MIEKESGGDERERKEVKRGQEGKKARNRKR